MVFKKVNSRQVYCFIFPALTPRLKLSFLLFLLVSTGAWCRCGNLFPQCPSLWNGCDGPWLRGQPGSIPLHGDSSETIIYNHALSQARHEWLCKTLRPISKWLHSLTKWRGHLWTASKWGEMEGIGFLQKWQIHPEASTLPSDKPYKAEISTLIEPAFCSMSLCPTVTRKNFALVLTGGGTTNLGSFGAGWNCACPPLSQEAVQDGGKAAFKLPAAGHQVDTHAWSPHIQAHAPWLASPELVHSGKSVISFRRPDLGVMGRLQKSGHSDLAAFTGSPVLSHFISMLKQVHALGCAGQSRANDIP